MESQIPSTSNLKKLGYRRVIQKLERSEGIILQLILSFFLTAMLYSCKKNAAEMRVQTSAITVAGIKPATGKVGDTIIITGTNFSLNPLLDTIEFNEVTVQVIKATKDTLFVIVPSGNCSGVVTVNGVSATGPVFTLIQTTITGIKPPTGKVGDTIIISGTNFNLNSLLDTIKFNGITAKVIKALKDTLFVIVPSGNCTGIVTVNGGTGNGPVFTLAQTTITAVNPNWGKQGDTILIMGTNFNPNRAKDTATINGVNALVQKASADTLYVIVPLTTSGTIIVNGVSAPAPGFVYGPTVIVSTVSGASPPPYYSGGYLDGPDALALFNQPTGFCFDKQGNLFVTEIWTGGGGSGRIREISGGIVSTFAGSQTGANIIGPKVMASFIGAYAIAIDSYGSIYVTEGLNTAIQGSYLHKITNGTVLTFTGGDSVWTINKNNSAAQFYTEFGGAMVFDSQGNLYVVVAGAVQKITPTGQLSTFAGKAPDWVPTIPGPPTIDAHWALQYGYQDGQDTNARFGDIEGLAVDGSDNIYAADMGCNCIRKITPSGLVSYYSLGTNSYHLPVYATPYLGPSGECVDAKGNLYATLDNSIVKITPTGVITTIAGSNAAGGFADGPPPIAQFNGPNALALDSLGNIYVLDAGNNRVRKITFLK
jgi:IPT/TIG domain/NHL repeat